MVVFAILGRPETVVAVGRTIVCEIVVDVVVVTVVVVFVVVVVAVDDAAAVVVDDTPTKPPMETAVGAPDPTKLLTAEVDEDDAALDWPSIIAFKWSGSTSPKKKNKDNKYKIF